MKLQSQLRKGKKKQQDSGNPAVCTGKKKTLVKAQEAMKRMIEEFKGFSCMYLSEASLW